MYVIDKQQQSLKDFPFWGKAKENADKLSYRQLNELEIFFIDHEPIEGWTASDINKYMWYNIDDIVQYLGYPDLEGYLKNITFDNITEAYNWWEEYEDEMDDDIKKQWLTLSDNERVLFYRDKTDK